MEEKKNMTRQIRTTVSALMIRLLKTYAESKGVDFNKAAARCHFNPDVLESSRARIPGEMFKTLWQVIQSKTRDPHPGINFGRLMAEHYPAGSVLFTLMLNSPTIENALEVLVRYHRIMSDLIQPQFEIKGDLTHLFWDTRPIDFKDNPQLSEAVVCTYHTLLRRMSRDRVRAVKICFAHSKPTDPDTAAAFKKIFKVPVCFGEPVSQLILNTRDLETPIDLADSSLYQILEAHAETLVRVPPEHALADRPWTRKVLARIRHQFAQGRVATIGSTARELALSTRALQERLKQESTRFRDLLQAVRKELAMHHLSRRELSICDIAFMLGYSEQSAFNHAFKRWTGQSPRSFIRQAAST